MTTKLLIRSVLALVLAAPLAVAAQQAPIPAPVPTPAADTMFFVSSGAPLLPFGGQVDVLRGEGAVVGEAIKDKPYTADAVTESTQILADGNRITNRNEARIYRDSQGRTRREQTLGGLGVWRTANEPVTMITINDPVANVSYFLDPRAHAAQEIRQFRLQLDPGQMRPGLGMPPGAPAGVTGPGPQQAVMIQRSFGPDAPPPGAGASATFELPVPPPQTLALAPATLGESVSVAHGGGAIGFGSVAGVAAFAPSAAGFAPLPALASATSETADLGEQVLEGVLARGTRQTQTIPTGAIGNERPIEIVAEQWYSDEIQAIVSRRTSDPRFGETTYRLVNLVRADPSPDLFTVPQGYEVQRPQEIESTIGPGGTPGQRVERRVFVVQPGPADAAK